MDCPFVRCRYILSVFSFGAHFLLLFRILVFGYLNLCAWLAFRRYNGACCNCFVVHTGMDSFRFEIFEYFSSLFSSSNSSTNFCSLPKEYILLFTLSISLFPILIYKKKNLIFRNFFFRQNFLLALQSVDFGVWSKQTRDKTHTVSLKRKIWIWKFHPNCKGTRPLETTANVRLNYMFCGDDLSVLCRMREQRERVSVWESDEDERSIVQCGGAGARARTHAHTFNRSLLFALFSLSTNRFVFF